MKNLQKGFVTPLLIIMGLLIIGGLAYFFLNKNITSKNIGNTQSELSNIVATTTNTFSTSDHGNMLTGKEIYIFVDDSTYNSLQQKINRLASDINSDIGAKVIIQHSNYSSPLEIRDILKQSYNHKTLAGSILIGSIPTFLRAGGLYTDWFYQDLDDDCSIASDGTFSFDCNSLTSVSKRDVFTGRITPPKNATNSVALIEKYLDKDHAYRQGEIVFPKKMLLYPSVSILERNNRKLIAKNPLSVNIAYSIDSQSRYTSQDVDVITETDYVKQKQEYLSKLKNNRYETAIVDIHGSQDGQFPSQNYDESKITSSDISQAAPNIFYVALLSCDNGAFKSPNYLAGEFLFNGDTLLVTANTEEASINGFLEDPPLWPVFFQPLSFLNSSLPLGQMFIHDSSFLITQVFGDPTLRIQGNSSIPQLNISDDSVDFGTITKGLKTKTVSITNISNSDVKILDLSHWQFTIDGKSMSDLSLSDPIELASGSSFMGFEMKFNIVGEPPYNTIILKPKQELNLSIQFISPVYSSNGLTVKGNYLGTYSLFTSDPTKPYIDLDLKVNQR